MTYVGKHRREWSLAHPREWVAIVGQQAFFSPDLDDGIRQAEAAGFEHPFVGGLQDPELFDAAFIGLT